MKIVNNINKKNNYFSFLLIIAFILLFLFLLFVLSSCEQNSQDILDQAFELISIDETIIDDINLDENIDVDGNIVNVMYMFDDDAISSTGEIYPYANEDREVNIKVRLSYQDKTNEFNYGKVVVKSMKYICEEVEKSVVVPSETTTDIELPTQIGKVRLRWNSSNTVALAKNGEVSYVDDDVNVKLSCIYSIKTVDDSYQLEKEYKVIVKTWDSETKFQKVLANVKIVDETIYDIDLPTELDFGIKGKWESSNDDVIDGLGRVNRQGEDTIVTLTLKLEDKENKYQSTFEVKVLKINKVDGQMDFYKHILINRAEDLNNNNMTGLVYNKSTGRIELEEGKLTGVYTSPIYNTNQFYRIVGSFSCITSVNSTCELEYSIRVDGKWSKFLSYGEFGLGRKNVYYDQYDTDAMIDTDMVIPLHDKLADGMKYRFTFRRKTLTDESPKLSLVATTFFIRDYKYNVDTSELPGKVDWDVPRLYQHDVPVIGNQICSATTTTMLLKFAGYSFSDKGYKYEHEYMSNMVADTGHNNPTYGNWSYNMMAAGAFGINAYVGKYYTWDEIKYHLANYGPLGSSISGQFGSYYTNGHLIVLRGYEEKDGKTTVICNDPNIKGTYYEVPLETYLKCMGSVVYIMEFNNTKIID